MLYWSVTRYEWTLSPLVKDLMDFNNIKHSMDGLGRFKLLSRIYLVHIFGRLYECCS